MASNKRKIAVSSSSSRHSRSPEREDYQRPRPSVFSRLGTKRSPIASSSSGSKSNSDPILCRNILELGICKFDSKCKYAHTHKAALTSRRSRRDHRSSPQNQANVDTDWQNWNEESLDYEDEKMLEKKRLLLQQELAKEDSDPEMNSVPDKQKKKPAAMMIPSSVLNNAMKAENNQMKKTSPASTSSMSSSSSSDSASSSSGSNSSGDEQPTSKKLASSVVKKVKSRDSSSSSFSEESPKKKLL